MIKLGVFVRDKVTGFIGVADNRATFLYGVDRYHVQPVMDKDGKVPKGMMIDEPQLEVMENIKRAMEPLEEQPQVISLGTEVHDPISDRKGTATGRAVYLHGCARMYLEPKHRLLTSDVTGWWADELQLVQKKKVVHKPKEKVQRTGGPARSNSKY